MDPRRLAEIKAGLGLRVSVCLPARDEEATVGQIVASVRRSLVERGSAYVSRNGWHIYREAYLNVADAARTPGLQRPSEAHHTVPPAGQSAAPSQH